MNDEDDFDFSVFGGDMGVEDREEKDDVDHGGSGGSSGSTSVAVVAKKKKSEVISNKDMPSDVIDLDSMFTSTPAAKLAPVKKKIEWSEQQKAIFELFKDKKSGNVTIVARAGSTKTTTSIEGGKYAPEASIFYAAFGKSIAKELSSRLPDDRCKAQTIHAAGMAIISQKRRGKVEVVKNCAYQRVSAAISEYFERPENKWDNEAIEYLRQNQWQPIKILELTKIMCPFADTSDEVLDVAIDMMVASTPPRTTQAGDLWPRREIPPLIDRVCDVVLLVMENQTEEAIAGAGKLMIDFNDMIWLPVRCGWVSPRYPLVVIDECQDLSFTQIELASGLCSGRIFIVGDDRQCHPSGTMIELTGGKRIPIEDVRPGDSVVSYHDCFRGIRTQGRLVEEVRSFSFTGNMQTIFAGGETSLCTDNHKYPTRLVSDGKSRWVTYLMELGEVSRIGHCSLRYTSRGSDYSFGPSMRLRQEGADRVWILEVFDDQNKAKIAETITALRFNLPENIFMEKGDIKSEILEAIGSNREKAINCLESFGRLYEYPIFCKGSGVKIGSKIYVTQACNLLSGVNELRTFDGTQSGGSWAAIDLIVAHRVEDELVHCLKVEPTEGGMRLYVADRILTHNSIYGWRGADSKAIERMTKQLKSKVMYLTTCYRCAKSIIKEAQKYVKDIRAWDQSPEGKVRWISLRKLPKLVKAGDFVVSRSNAPLMMICLRLIATGIRALMAGNDIGKQMLKMIEDVEGNGRNKVPFKSAEDMWERLVAWGREEKVAIEEMVRRKFTSATQKRIDQEILNRVESLKDKLGMISVMLKELKTPAAVKTRMMSLFEDQEKDGEESADRNNYVLCSSVHKAKGLEAESVFVLRDTLRTKNEEEVNICYVAVTRARENLWYVSACIEDDEEMEDASDIHHEWAKSRPELGGENEKVDEDGDGDEY